jgi:Ca-activated chloride channel family protein
MGHDVFISHSSIDKAIADAVTAALENAQIRCWIAPRDITPGDSWGGSIIEGIEGSRVMVIVFSSHSNDSKQVMREVERAVQKDVVVVPFRVENIQPSRDMEYFLSSTHWLDAVTPEMDNHLADLVQTTQKLLDMPVTKAAKVRVVGSEKVEKPSVIDPPKKSKLPIYIVAGLAVLAAAWFFLISGDDSSLEDTSSSTIKDQGKSTKAIPVREVGSVKLDAPKKAIAATQLPVVWKGSGANTDYLMISKHDAQPQIYSQRSKAGGNTEVDVLVPDAPGKYELRYWDSTKRIVLAKQSLQVVAPDIELNADRVIGAGKFLSVEWSAPNNKNDYLAIAETGSKANAYFSYAYTKKGSPTEIRVPDLSGEYQLRYISAQTKAIWASTPIKVADNDVSIEAIVDPVLGSEIEVSWQGPANKGDYLAVATRGSKGKEYLTYSYVKPATTTKLKMAEVVGEYEVRYISGQSNEIWSSQIIKLVMPSISLDAIESAQVGSEVVVDWQGPANRSDYISVAELGSEGEEYLNYKYVRQGTELSVRAPDRPGRYEIRYISAQNKFIWAETEIEIVERTEKLSVADRVAVGEKFEVTWQEKGNKGEYIAVYKKGADVKNYESYVYTNRKVRAKLSAPSEPGEYELRYISGQEGLEWANIRFEVD